MEHHKTVHAAECGGRLAGAARACAGLVLAAVLLLPWTAATAFDWTCQSQANESCNFLTGCCGSMVCDPLAGFKCHHVPAHAGELCTVLGFCEDANHYYCKGFQEGLAGRCEAYQGVGESCIPFYSLCDNPAKIAYSASRGCQVDLRTLLPYLVALEPGGDVGAVPWDLQVLACYPTVNLGGDIIHYGFNPENEDDCKSAWSSSVHDDVIAKGNARAYSAGVFAGVVGAHSRQWGVVYGADGTYACYRETCWGAMSTVAIGSFLSYSEYDSYADFSASNRGWSAGGGEGIGIFYGRAFKGPEYWSPADDPSLLTRVGTVVGYGADASLLPVSAEWLECENVMAHEYTYQPGPPPRLTPKVGVTLSCRNTYACADPVTCTASPSISGNPGTEPVPVKQEPPGPYALGSRTVTLAPQVEGQASACTAVLEVYDCTPPAIQCPAPVTAECQASGMSSVVLGTPMVTDCSATEVASPQSPLYPLGTTTVTFAAVDGSANQATCDTTVTVVDTQPPEIRSVTATPSVLWPPDHTMRSVRIDVVAVDACGTGATCRPSGITSSEPADGRGDGSTDVDTAFVNETTVSLRAERLGSGTGRVYVVAVECRDGAGNVSRSSVPVLAPHDSTSVP